MFRAFFAGQTAPLGALLVLAFLTACADRGADQQAIADSALARDLALVQSVTTAQPTFRDTALTEAPAPRRESTTPREPLARGPGRQVPTRDAEARQRQPRQARPVAQRRVPRPTRVAEPPAP